MLIESVPSETLSDDDREELRATLREYLAAHVTESSVRTDMIGASYDRALWRALAVEMGVQGLGIRESAGGAGFGAREIAMVMAELGRVVYAGPYFSTIVLAAELLRSADDAVLADSWLSAITAGNLTATVALHESTGQLALDHSQVEATRRDDGWVVRGDKYFVLDGADADLVLVPAMTDAGIAVFAVQAADLTPTRLSALDLTRPLADLHFDDAPAVLVIDAPGALDALSRLVDSASVLLTAEQVGAAQRVLEFTVMYAVERFQFGRPIGSFQAVKHDCANMLVGIEGSRAISEAAIESLASHEPSMPGLVDAAAAFSSDAFVRVAETAIQVHGGMGFTWEHPCHVYLKRAKSDSIMLRSSRERRRRIARTLDL